MGAGPQMPYPKWVWTPAGGWCAAIPSIPGQGDRGARRGSLGGGVTGDSDRLTDQAAHPSESPLAAVLPAALKQLDKRIESSLTELAARL